MLVLVGLLTLSEPASAAGFQAKTMRSELPPVEVERPLIIGRGWLELGLGGDVKIAREYWGDDGTRREFADQDGTGGPDVTWLYTTQRAAIRYGIARRGELYLTVPVHYVRLTNSYLGTDTSDFGYGDASFGWKREWYRTDAPLVSIISDLFFRVGSGNEAAGTLIGGPNTVGGFVMSTGTSDLGLAVRGKGQAGPFAFQMGVGYARCFSGVSQFVIETDGHQFVGRFKPGDYIKADLNPMIQVGPLAIGADASVQRRFSAQAGTTSPGLYHDAYLDPIAGSEGTFVDVGGNVVLNVTRNLDVGLGASVPIRGQGLAFFPLETISPTLGPTYSGTLELRY